MRAFKVLTPSMGKNPQKRVALRVLKEEVALVMLFRASKVKSPEVPTSKLRVFKDFKGAAFKFLTTFVVLKSLL